MPMSDRAARFAALLAVTAPAIPASITPANAQTISAFPDQTSHIRLSNRDVNHLVCAGGDIEDVRYSAEKGLAVERSGSDAWIKFLVLETEDMGLKTRTYVTAPSEFFVSCNGAVYPLYAEPSDIPAQTVNLLPGQVQRARSNDALLAPLVEEERAVGITLAVLQERVPASFSEVAPVNEPIVLEDLPDIAVTERRRFEIDGAGLSVSEYRVRPVASKRSTSDPKAAASIALDERWFLNTALGSDIFSVTLDRLTLAAGDAARLVVVRRSQQP